MDNEKKKILIVDDNENLVTVLVDKFSKSGFETLGAVNGEDGLKKALEFHPDIILLDLVMPVMDGLGMLKQLREDVWGKTAKVMILTLLDDAGYVANAMDANVLGYIVKTDLSLDGIVKQIKTVLKII
ncbi:MAG: response regulator [Patescibacteria group bacterium]